MRPEAFRRLRRTGAAFVLAASLGCEDPVCCAPPPPEVTLLVTTVTTGVNIDADGYRVAAVEMSGRRDSVTVAVGANATIAWALEPAAYLVWLTDVQANCVPLGDHPRRITIVQGDTVSSTFAVTCSA